MYIPPFNRMDDRETLTTFMRGHPFATLITTADGSPYATHLPFIIEDDGEAITLKAHLSKANPHWRHFDSENESLVVFQGPHAYIAPRWYESREAVPTWNYAAVHAYGTPMILDDDATLDVLSSLIDAFDPNYREQWDDLSQEYRSNLRRGIVGFEMRVSRLEGKFKLSQNRPVADQERIIRELSVSDDSNAAETARLMRLIRP